MMACFHCSQTYPKKKMYEIPTGQYFITVIEGYGPSEKGEVRSFSEGRDHKADRKALEAVEGETLGNESHISLCVKCSHALCDESWIEEQCDRLLDELKATDGELMCGCKFSVNCEC